MGTTLLIVLSIAGCYLITTQCVPLKQAAADHHENDEKRGPFYQWSGKRSESDKSPEVKIAKSVKEDASAPLKESNPANSLEVTNVKSKSQVFNKRGPFYQWSGKRADDTNLEEGIAEYAALNGVPEKRGPFYQWSGKRSDELSENEAEKRGPFYQWSGKRADSDAEANTAEKRGPFYQWSGKRSEMEEEKRGPFYQWSGKRSDDAPVNEEQLETTEVETETQQDNEQNKNH